MISDLDLQNGIISKVKPIISEWIEDEIYAISFFVYNKEDNPCEPTFTLGFNTERDYQNALVNGAVDEHEARWNYAWWAMNNYLVFGDGETAEIVKQWITSRGWPYFTSEEFFNIFDDKNFEFKKELFEELPNVFAKILVDVVKHLHESEFIKNKFGKEIPIIIHEFEYYDEIAIQNIEANTLPLVQGLIDFIGYCPE